MILNAYAVLDAFLSLLRLLLGLAVIWLGVQVWRQWKALTIAPERRRSLEDRSYLLFLLAFLLLILNLASWPVFYLLLQSYVPEWPGVMCIYGVTQIGKGSSGPSRFLPRLLTTLQLLKPVVVFLTGAWFVLYLVNRRTSTAPLTSRVLLMVVLLGVLAVLDASAEGAYLAIPKKEEFPPVGCCAGAFDFDSREAGIFPRFLSEEGYRPWLYGAYYGSNMGMTLALAGYVFWPSWRQTGVRLAPLAAGALVSVPISLAFLVEIAAPALLHMPQHHCPYDLITAAPGSIVAVGLLAVGSFCAGWGCVASWFGNCSEAMPFLSRDIRSLLYLGLLGYVASLVMLSVELART